ncbi:protein dehydratase [bacterium]|nr:protein dehydratase [bacterium]
MDLDHLRQWIGREEVSEDILTPALIARFNATFDRSDAEPALIHLCLCLPHAPTATLGPDGHPLRGGFLPPVPLQRRMWAGGSFTFAAPIRPLEPVQRRSRIVDVTGKTGQSGPLCFVTVEHALTQGGALRVTERHDIVYRDPAPAPPPGPAAPSGTVSRRVSASATLLFRYSALTFNAHRIHYDAPYATQEEAYPGIVIHGPMQATLLCQLAQDLKGARPRRFDFRSRAPLFGPSDFILNAEETPEGMRLWTAAPGGPVAMEATARW